MAVDKQQNFRMHLIGGQVYVRLEDLVKFFENSHRLSVGKEQLLEAEYHQEMAVLFDRFNAGALKDFSKGG